MSNWTRGSGERPLSSAASTRRQIRRATLFGGERGQMLVEIAFVLPILLLLLLGAVEFGRFCYAAIEVSNAAGAGARYGSQNHVTAWDPSGMRQAALNDAPNVSGLSAAPRHPPLSACSDGSVPTGSPLVCAGSARLIEYVQVNTSATVSPIFHYPGIPTSIQLQGQAIMRVAE